MAYYQQGGMVAGGGMPGGVVGGVGGGVVGGGGGATCGGCSCSAEGAPVMSYVGGGGDYIQETTYKYVGMGAGEFDVRQDGAKADFTCFYVMGGVGVLVVAVVLIVLFVPWGPVVSTTTALPYDCNAGYANW